MVFFERFEAVDVLVAVGLVGVIVEQDGCAVDVEGYGVVGFERLASESGDLVVIEGAVVGSGAVVEYLAGLHHDGTAVFGVVAAGCDAVGGVGPAEGDVTFGVDAEGTVGAGGVKGAAEDVDGADVHVYVAAGVDAGLVGAATSGVDGATVLGEGAALVDVDAVIAITGGVDGAAVDGDVRVHVYGATGVGDAEGAGALGLAVDGEAVEAAMEGIVGAVVGVDAEGGAVAEDEAGVAVDAETLVDVDGAGDDVPALGGVVHAEGGRAVVVTELVVAADDGEVGAGLCGAVGVDVGYFVVNADDIALGADLGVGGGHGDVGLTVGVGDIAVGAGLAVVVADDVARADGEAAVVDDVGTAAAEGNLGVLNVVVGVEDGDLVAVACAECHAVGQGEGADDAHLEVGLSLKIDPAKDVLVGGAAHVEGADNGGVFEEEGICAERGRRGGEDVHSGEAVAVIEGTGTNAGHAGGDGDGGDGVVIAECILGDGDGTVGEGDVAVNASTAVGHVAEIDDGGTGPGGFHPLRFIEGLDANVDEIVAAVDGGKVGVFVKSIITDIGDAVADVDGGDGVLILLPGAVTFIPIVVVCAARTGDAERAVVVVAPAGVVATRAGHLSPLGVERDRRAVGGGDVGRGLLVGVACAAAVGLGVPALEHVVLAGEGVGGKALCCIVGEGLIVHRALAAVGIIVYGVMVGRPRGVEGDGLAGGGFTSADAQWRLAEVDGGGAGVLAVGVSGAAEGVAGARWGGDLEVVGGHVIGCWICVGHAVLSVHCVVEGDGVLARVAVGHGELAEDLWVGGEGGTERAVVGRAAILGRHIHVGVQLRVGGSPRRGRASEGAAAGTCYLDVRHVVVRAGERELRVAAVARMVKIEAVGAPERQLPFILLVSQLQAVVEVDGEARSARGVLNGRCLRAGAVAEAGAAGREGERPTIHIVIGMRSGECVGHSLACGPCRLSHRQCYKCQHQGEDSVKLFSH